MSIYKKAPFDHVSEFSNKTTKELFATPEFAASVEALFGNAACIAAIEQVLVSRAYANNAAAITGGLVAGQLYNNTTTKAITVVV